MVNKTRLKLGCKNQKKKMLIYVNDIAGVNFIYIGQKTLLLSQRLCGFYITVLLT